MLTFTGGPLKKSYRVGPGSPAALLALALVIVIVVQALGAATLRDTLISSLGFERARGFGQLGVVTHWLVDASSLAALMNAAYLLLAGSRLQAEYGRLVPLGLFLVGAVLGVGMQLGFGHAPDVILGASGAAALWMGMASAPYALAGPVEAWGTVTLEPMRLRLPFVAVVIVWFVQQGLGMVLADRGAGHEHAAALAEFGLGVILGLAAGRILKLLGPEPSDDLEPAPSPSAQPVAQAVEMVRKKPRLAVTMLQRILREDRTNVQASLALLDAHLALEDREGAVEEGMVRIAALVRSGQTSEAAAVYGRLVQLQCEGPLASRLSATIVGAVIEALAAVGEPAVAVELARRWCAAHTRDPDAWRVRELLADLQKQGTRKAKGRKKADGRSG